MNATTILLIIVLCIIFWDRLLAGVLVLAGITIAILAGLVGIMVAIWSDARHLWYKFKNRKDDI